MGFSRQEHWRGLLRPPAGDLPDPGMELRPLRLLHWQAGPLPRVPPGKPVTVTSLFNFLDSADVISYSVCVSLPYLAECNKDLACSPWAFLQSHLHLPLFLAPWLILVGPCGISPFIFILRCSYPTLLLYYHYLLVTFPPSPAMIPQPHSPLSSRRPIPSPNSISVCTSACLRLHVLP